jgi:hypothetical protein
LITGEVAEVQLKLRFSSTEEILSYMREVIVLSLLTMEREERTVTAEYPVIKQQFLNGDNTTLCFTGRKQK